jgi:Fe-S-cluster-containing dehydrogenase component/NADPH-dependent 2,4-dienoyl-CoA reductase/sulfur reductase-like enzyme/pSer/pThr/pTyr-binding forkhead associated (FHA) protein
MRLDEHYEYVILGNGAAAVAAVTEICRDLRNANPSRILQCDPDPDGYYYRAALTNYLLGELNEHELRALPSNTPLPVTPAETKARRLDVAGKVVELDDGRRVRYEKLLIACGARANLPTWYEHGKRGHHCLRTHEDAQRIVSALGELRRQKNPTIVVQGGGILGLEFAEALHMRLRALKPDIHIVHGRPAEPGTKKRSHLFDAVLDIYAGKLLQQAIENDGVKVSFNADIRPAETWRAGYEVALPGAGIVAQMLVASIGITPNTDWLARSGLELDKDGYVAVDRSMRVKGQNDIFAAGDVAKVDERDMPAFNGKPVGNAPGLWQPAQYQGRIAGRNMAGSDSAKLDVYRPGFLLNSTRAWGYSIDSAGVHAKEAKDDDPAFEVVEKDRVIYKRAVLQDGRLAGFLLFGDRREARALTTLLDLRVDDGTGNAFDGPILPPEVRERLFDPSFPLNAWVAAQAGAARRRWSKRDSLSRGIHAPGKSLVRDTGRYAGIGMTNILRRDPDKNPLIAERPLLLDIGGKREEPLIKGPVWIGNHEKAKWGREFGLPRNAAMRLDPWGLTWVATNMDGSDFVQINGAWLERATALNAYDVLTVGGWRAIVLPDEEQRSRASGNRARTARLRNSLRAEPLAMEGVVRIGSLERENDIVLTHEGAANFHAQIHVYDGVHELRRAGSIASLKIDGVEVTNPVELRSGQKVDFNGSVWEFEIIDGAAVAAGPVRGGIAGFLCPQNGPDTRALPLSPRNGVIRIGRAAECELQLGDPLLSRVHAEIRLLGRKLTLRDHKSINGTTLNDHLLSDDEELEIPDGSMLKLGAYTYRFSSGTRPPEGVRIKEPAAVETSLSIEGTRLKTERGKAEAAASQPAFIRRVRLTPLENAIFPKGKLPLAELTREGAMILGRASSRSDATANKLLLPAGADSISREHAEISVMPNGVFLRDLESKKGTALNGNQIGSQPILLSDGDVITLAGIAEFEVGFPDMVGEDNSAKRRARSGSSVFWLDKPNALEDDLPSIVAEELDACIGCHACMRACPLPDAQNVSIAALNSAAASGAFATDVARNFVQDCTQCRACVPVCPVGIERSRIVLWNKLKLEVDPAFDPPLQLGNSKDKHKLGCSIGVVSSSFENGLLDALSEGDRLALLARCQYRWLSAGETLIEADNYVSTLWIVYEGGINWGLPAASGSIIESLYYGPGKVIAARAFLADEPCRHRVSAHRDGAIVIGIPRAVVKQFAGRSDTFKNELKKLGDEFDPKASIPALGNISEAEKAASVLCWFESGDKVVSRFRGMTDAVVLRGYVAERESSGDSSRIVTYHRVGALLTLPTPSQPIRFHAKTEAELLLLPPSAAERMRQATTSRKSTSTSESADLPSRGRQIMAIDMTLCIDCNNCVDACGRRHGHPRIDRNSQGVQFGVFHIPNACYHCEDPKCLICDVGGIVRTDKGEITIVDDACIGCGACAERCPYDNIKLVPRASGSSSWSLSSLFDLIGLARKEWYADDLKPQERKASKCDLCAGHDDGPACVRACPTGAAVRRPLAEILASAGGIENER